MRNAILVALVMLAASLAQAQQNSAVWCVGESTKVKPGDSPQASNLTWQGDSKTVTLGSAANEYVAFQIAVRATGDSLKGVTVESADLAGPGNAVIAKSNVDLFVEHYLNVTVSSRGDANHLMPDCTAGEHPTQMVPFNAKKFGAPFDIGAGRNQPVWVDVYVPEGTKAGKYAGVFTVKDGAGELARLNVALEVWNFTLPNETHFRTWLYTGPENLKWAHRMPDDNSPEFIALEDQYFQMAHQHRINFHPSGGDPVQDALVRYYKYYSGTGFTDRVGKGVGQNVIPLNPGNINTKTTADAWAKATVQQWEAKKTASYPMCYVWDEPHTPSDFANSKNHSKWIHEAVGKKLNTMIATPDYLKYEPGDVDIFTEPAADDVPKIIARGDHVWSVNAAYSPGPFVDAPGYGARCIPWMASKMHCEGYQFWDVCYWVDKQNRRHKENGRWTADFTMAQVNAHPEKYLEDLWNNPLNFDESRKKGYPVNDSIRNNGDGILFYPGHDIGIEGPIASYAMKSLRRGIQDYEYIWMVQQQGKEAQAQPIVDSVCPAPEQWNKDPESWDRARLELAKLLNK